MNKINKKQLTELAELARKNGNNADLLLLTKITEVDDKVDNIKSELEIKINDKTEEIKSLIPEAINGEDGKNGKDGIDGQNADEEKIIKNILRQIPKPKDGKNGKDGLTPAIDTAQIAEKASKMAITVILPQIPTIEAIEADLPRLGVSVRDSLELLQDNERLDIKAIKGLLEELEELKKLRTRSLGGGGGLSASALALHFINDETPQGTINGINTDFVLDHTPSPTNSLKVYRGGARQRIAEDYTLSGRTITFLIAPVVNEIIFCDYMK